jgi:chemotaxis response regulator CheB
LTGRWGVRCLLARIAAVSRPGRRVVRRPLRTGVVKPRPGRPVNAIPLGVVGIGASAGGIEAFRLFFEKMPADRGLAFVAVLHRVPGRKSMLADILSRWTDMPVIEARDGDAIRANHVLVIPAGAVASLRDGRLSLRRISPEAPRETTPIDAFFDSMAQGLNEDAIGDGPPTCAHRSLCVAKS